MAQKSIAKNTLFLTLRMLLLMGITFFTSRVVLDKLGVEGYGIYNVVSSLAVSFSFFISSLTNATQRFITIEIGKGNHKQAKRIFNQHLEIYFFIALGCFLVGELAGVWFIQNKLNIPYSRITDAIWVFQFALLTIVTSLLTIPSESCVIAHEDMNVYSYVGVMEGIVKLCIAYLITISPFNKLIFYAILMFLASSLSQSFYILYARLHYIECRIQRIWDVKLLKQSFSFISWNILGTARAAIITQGMDFVLNIYLGPVANAARAVTNQVDGAIFKFSSNLMIAAQPQLVKSYAQGESGRLNRLFFKTTRFSFYVLWLLICPFLLCINSVLHLWLKIVPQWTEYFIFWGLLSSLVYVLTKPMWSLILAVGKLEKYVIFDTFTSVLIIPLAVVLLKLGYSPVSVYMASLGVQVLNTLTLLLVIKNYIHFSLIQYGKKVLLQIVYVSIVSLLLVFILSYLVGTTGFYVFVYYPLGLIANATVIYLIGLYPDERQMVINKIKSIVSANNK